MIRHAMKGTGLSSGGFQRKGTIQLPTPPPPPPHHIVTMYHERTILHVRSNAAGLVQRYLTTTQPACFPTYLQITFLFSLGMPRNENFLYDTEGSQHAQRLIHGRHATKREFSLRHRSFPAYLEIKFRFPWQACLETRIFFTTQEFPSMPTD